MLITLEKIIGEQTLQKALHTYFMRYRFTHPTQEDFMQTVNEVAGQDLSWYWNQAVYGTQVLDYEVKRADSDPINWCDDEPEEKKGETEYETQVILHRKGDFIFPVEAVVNSTTARAPSNAGTAKTGGCGTCTTRRQRLSRCSIDPDYQVTLDRDYLNNSKTTETQHGAAHKIGIYWMFLTQFLAQMMSWLV